MNPRHSCIWSRLNDGGCGVVVISTMNLSHTRRSKTAAIWVDRRRLHRQRAVCYLLRVTAVGTVPVTARVTLAARGREQGPRVPARQALQEHVICPFGELNSLFAQVTLPARHGYHLPSSVISMPCQTMPCQTMPRYGALTCIIIIPKTSALRNAGRQ